MSEASTINKVLIANINKYAGVPIGSIAKVNGVDVSPAPVEYTEEQTEYSTWLIIGAAHPTRAGQKLTIPNRQVTKLAFYTLRYGGPSGDVTFLIRKASDDSPIASKMWGNANTLPTDLTWVEVAFDEPVTINDEVRILLQFEGGSGSIGVAGSHYLGSVKDNELWTQSLNGGYTDKADQEGCYRYKYYEV